MLPIFYSEQQFIDTLPLTDRAIHYGDGLFETIAIKNNKPELLDDHLIRLSEGCQCLQFPRISFTHLKLEIQTLLNKVPQKQAILKIILTRGSGGRGYAPPKDPKPRIILGIYPWPEHYTGLDQLGINVFLCKTKLAYNQKLARIKHLNRLEQVLARLEFSAEEYQEGLMFAENETVIEGTMSNLFIVKDNNLLTPNLDSCGVAGIMRKRILHMALSLGFNCEEGQINKDMLLSADEVFLCNSIIKIWPVVRIMQQRFLIGKKTSQLMKLL